MQFLVKAKKKNLSFELSPYNLLLFRHFHEEALLQLRGEVCLFVQKNEQGGRDFLLRLLS